MPTVHDDVRRTAEGVEVGTRVREYIAGALYRCRRCQRTRRIDYPARTTTTYYARRNHAWGFATQGREVRTAYTLPDGTTSAYPPALPCEGCGRALSAQVIHGTRNDAIPCGPRCLNATGPQCECACGGRNHGKHHSH